MSIDAGTVYSSIRLKLDSLDRDINSAIGKLDGLVGRMSKVGANVQNIEKFGKSLTLGVTVPLVAASAALVKFASDEGESLNAANVVFGKSSKIITDWGENAAKQAGLAKSEFYQAGAVIGAGLKNAGFSLDDAANQTINLTQRAADMASIFNTDVNDAMLALQSALRGEYEPARRFAVSLSETAVKAEAMRLGIAKTGEELSTYQKTQARLSLIMQQTAQFQGDFVSTSDQLANSTRILQAELKNEAAQLGRELLPALLDIIKGARGIVENFSKLDEGTKKTVLAIAGFAAATGPVILGITNTIKAVEALKIAMLALAANPISLVIAGVAALGVGLKALGDENNKRMIEDVGERFKNVGELAEVSAQNIVDVEEVLARMSRGGGTATELKDSIKQIAEDTGLTAEQIVAIATHSEKTTAEFRDQVVAADKMLKSAAEQAALDKIRLSWIKGTTEYAEREERAKKKTVESAKEENGLSDDAQKQIAARIKAEEEYQDAISKTDFQLKSNLISSAEANKQNFDAANKYIDALYELGYAAENEVGTKGYNAMQKMLAIVLAYNESQKTQTENYEYFKELLGSINELDISHRENALKGLKEQIEASDMDIEKKKEVLKLLESITDATAKAAKESSLYTKASELGVNTLMQAFSLLGEQIAKGSLGWEDFAKLGINAIATMIEALAQEILAATAAQFMLQGGIFSPAAWANNAKGLASAAGAFAAAGLVRGFAGNFADGGIVPGNSFTGDQLIARVNSGEEVITRDDPRNVLNGGGNMVFILEVDGLPIAQATAPYFSNGQVRLKLK